MGVYGMLAGRAPLNLSSLRVNDYDRVTPTGDRGEDEIKLWW